MRQIELETPIDEMDESDLRATFSDVMDAHNENVTEFAEVQERAENADEFSARIEELEADREEAVSYFSERAAEVTNINEEILADRFSVDELVEMAGEADEQAAEFSEEAQEGGDPDEGDDETLFADKQQKSPAFSTDDLDDRKEAARDRLDRMGGIQL